MMAASRMSRIASHRLVYLLIIAAAGLSPALSDATTSEGVEDAELISDPRTASEHAVAFSGADGGATVSTSPYDLKKHNSNKKSQKYYPKTEADWNFKGEGKKTDVFIKDPKDNRLLRLVTEGLIVPQDILPIVSNDAITSSQKSVNNGQMSVTVQPEGMSGVVYDGLTADSDEKIIIERKKNATKERTYTKVENDVSRESEEHVKINLDANAGVQSPHFNKQKGSIAVPAQKHISLSRRQEPFAHKKQDDTTFEVVSLNKQKDNTDEGVFDFVDSPLSNKNLVPAGTAQTSRINVKKGPNGLDYEYEYIYYYYDDGDENGNHSDKMKGNAIPISSTSPGRTTTPIPNRSTSSTTIRYTKPFIEDNTGSRIKSPDVSNPSQAHQSRDKFRPDFRYTVDSAHILPASPPSSNKQSNNIYWQYENTNSNRFPGRQIPHQVVSEQPLLTTISETFPTTKQITRGRVHLNTEPVTTIDDSSFIVTAEPEPTHPPRDLHNRGRTTGSVRQPGLELVDSNSFRTHSTSIPIEYDKNYFSNQNFESSAGKSLKQDSSATHNFPPTQSNTKTETFRTREQTIEYVTETERLSPTISSRVVSHASTENVVDNTQQQSTLPENSLTTVYGAGLTDKAAHDLYAIYQQTQNEDTVKNTIVQDDRTTIVDEADNSFVATNSPTTVLFTTTTTTATSTTTTTEAPTTSTTTAAPIFSSLPGRGRFRGNALSRSRHPSTSTETAATSSDTASESSERPKSRFSPSARREPGQRVSYGRKGTSTTTPSDSDLGSSVSSSAESSTRSGFHPPPRSRFRSHSNGRLENTNSETTSNATPVSRPNFADRYNRRRPGLRSTTTSAPSPVPEEEYGSAKQEGNGDDTSSVEPQQSTTFKSVRSKINLQGTHVRPLRPGPKLSLSGRGRFGVTSSTTAVPLDADTSGSADVPVEQQTSEDSNVEREENSSEAVSSSTLPPATSTAHPDPLTRLKNRPNKLRGADKGPHVKPQVQVQVQQSNTNASLNQNRRPLVSNLLPRKKQPTTTTEALEINEEQDENSPRPVAEEVVEEAASKSDVEASEAQVNADVSSTTESKLSSLLASRRRNLSRRPGTIMHHNKQANEES